MSPSSSPPWATGFSLRRGGPANPRMRVSDAERAEVADRLSKHYGDGRLDQAEFDERMARAMSAKTHGDFAGLFADLPDLPGPDATGTEAPRMALRTPQGPGHVLSKLILLVAVVAGAVVLGHVLAHSFFPWLLIALLAFLWLRNGPRYRRHF